MEECLGVNGMHVPVREDCTVEEYTGPWCNALLYNTFYGRRSHFLNGLIKLSYVLLYPL